MSELGKVVHKWWEGMQKNRASRAELRHARTTMEALFVPSCVGLVYSLKSLSRSPSRVAAVAVILAHVKKDSIQKVARDIGRKNLKEDKAVLSEVRFRRLLHYDTADELLLPMVRLVRQLGYVVNVEDMAESVIYWGDYCKRRWVFDYYAASIASPSPDSTE